MTGRKVCICSRCSKKKLHFGLGMCSACLRRTKRETKPSFYLGTCYSEMSRRVKTFDKLRPNYFGKEICTKDEFISKFINDSKFLELYSGWQDNYFQRKFAPSIDRINNDLDYTLDNIEFISQSSNSKKDWSNKVYVIEGGIKKIFESQLDLAKYLNTHTSIISIKINTNKKYKGLEIGKL